MYELVCRSTEDRKAWIHTIRKAIMKCPEEGKYNVNINLNNTLLYFMGYFTA